MDDIELTFDEDVLEFIVDKALDLGDTALTFHCELMMDAVQMPSSK